MDGFQDSRGRDERGSRSDPMQRTLSPDRQRLVRLMQTIHFGRIERLKVRDGQPLFDPMPRVLRSVKIAGKNGPRPEIIAADFALKREMIEFFEHLDQVGDGMVLVIEVAHGLPLLLEIEQTVIA
jgi:hypothetical protein